MRSHFKRRTHLFRWPSGKSMKAVRARIRDLTDRRRNAGVKDLRDVTRRLDPLRRGWGNDFRTGNASRRFRAIDRYAAERFVEELGPYRLLGTIRYPGGVHAA